MGDGCWREIERELRREEPPDEAAVERVVARIRREPAAAAPRAGAWAWLTRRRLVPVTPLWALGGAAAAVLAALALAGALWRSPEVDPAMQAVQFVLVAPEAARVSLAGDFNDWDRDATPLRRASGAGVWSVVVPLRSGRYRYVFVVDGTRWVPDVAAPRGPEDEFGPSSVVLVGGGST